MRALSVRQPWAWLIVNGHKPIENRDWATNFRGEVLIHAGLTMTRPYYADVAADIATTFDIQLPAYETLERGGIVGVATIVDCVTESESLWFQGEYGFVLENARPLPFHSCKGALSFFDVQGVDL